MSNILDRLLKTKAELEEQLEIEHEKEVEKETERLAVIALENQRILQENLDNHVQWEVGELANKIKPIIGEKVTDNNFMLLLICFMFIYWGRVNENTLFNKLEGLVRKYQK